MTVWRQELVTMSPDDYHRDPCTVPSLSASIAHELTARSPLHAMTRHPKLGGISRAPTKSFDRGTLSHAILLGAGMERIEVIDAPDFRKKVTQEARDAAIDVGKVPVLACEVAEVRAVAKTLRGRFADYGITLDGRSEVAAFWVEETDDGAKVQCRGQQDHVKLESAVVYDLKSCRSAHPDACQKHVNSYGYATQRAAYVSALEKLFPALAGRIDFVFVFFELEPPYAVTPVRMSGAFRELGERRWRRAVNTWERCLRENRWPSYVDRIIDLEPSSWTLAQEMSAEFSEDPEWEESAQ